MAGRTSCRCVESWRNTDCLKSRIYSHNTSELIRKAEYTEGPYVIFCL
jgi:hypothetical protein